MSNYLCTATAIVYQIREYLVSANNEHEARALVESGDIDPTRLADSTPEQIHVDQVIPCINAAE